MNLNWRTAWLGQDIVVYRDGEVVDRVHAPDIQRVIFVYRNAGDTPGDLAFAMVELADEHVIFPPETGFAGREATLVENMVEELEVIERDTDRLQVEVRRTLFKLEKDLPPVDVMFLYQIIEWIGDVADRAERVGNRLEQLLAR